MKLIKLLLLSAALIALPVKGLHAQDFDAIFRQAKAMAEASAPAVFLSAPGTEMKDIVLKRLFYPDYYLLTWEMNGSKGRLELPATQESGYLKGTDGVWEFDLSTLILTQISSGDQLEFKFLGTSSGASVMPFNGNNNYPSNNGGTSVTYQEKCSFCNGKGWRAGSKGTNYGTGQYWCSECQRTVNSSHSHDRCPSCQGRGYIEKIR